MNKDALFKHVAAMGDKATNDWPTPIPNCPQEDKSIRDRAWTDEQITAAARALCNRSAEVCNVDPQDNWYLYAHEFIEDAKAALSAINGATP